MGTSLFAVKDERREDESAVIVNEISVQTQTSTGTDTAFEQKPSGRVRPENPARLSFIGCRREKTYDSSVVEGLKMVEIFERKRKTRRKRNNALDEEAVPAPMAEDETGRSGLSDDKGQCLKRSGRVGCEIGIHQEDYNRFDAIGPIFRKDQNAFAYGEIPEPGRPTASYSKLPTAFSTSSRISPDLTSAFIALWSG
jgi:hypothetical protein